MKSKNLLQWTVRAFLMIVIAGNALTIPNMGVSAKALADAPTNDDFDSALVVSSFPFTDTQDTTLATTDGVDDPSFPIDCSSGKGTNSVWYSITPASTGQLTLDTFGSDYDTMLAVWTGARGSLDPVGCNDDDVSSVQSRLVIMPVSAGETYYVEVAGYGESSTEYGTLVFNAQMPPPFTSCSSITQIPPAECDVLKALYSSTGGTGWANNTDWLQTATPCQWYGVSCSNGTNVTGLDLSWNYLSGPFPTNLDGLTQLTDLDLGGNYFNSGSIPTNLGNLANLSVLRLDYNSLTGSIPIELGNLSNLTELNLSYNQLDGSIPTQLGNLSKLTYLYLCNNQLTGSIPTEFVNLTNLIVLNLSYNSLDGSIPAELGSLLELQYLYLYSNQFSGEFPTSLTNLFNLTSFSFDQCQGLTSSDPDVIAFIDNIVGPGWQCTPVILEIIPDEGPSSGGTIVTIYGDNLADATSVTVGGVNASFTVDFDSNLVVTTPAHAVGAVDITITNSYGDGTATGAFTYRQMVQKIFTSSSTLDGWILESSENSKKGGTLNTTTTTFNLGDDAAKKQYLGILSFATGAALPDNAVITQATLKVRKNVIVGGGNPLTTFQGFMVDIKKGFFGTSALQATDFQTAANNSYGPFTPVLVSNWYSMNLVTNINTYINKTSSASGLTQIRLRFKLDDNNNRIANYLRLFSGNAGATSRPQLIIQYYIPSP